MCHWICADLRDTQMVESEVVDMNAKQFGLAVVLLSAAAVIAGVITIAYRWYVIWNEIFNHASY